MMIAGIKCDRCGMMLYWELPISGENIIMNARKNKWRTSKNHICNYCKRSIARKK